jgi:ParB family chromosome partitioning protein
MYQNKIVEIAPRKVAMKDIDDSPGPFCMSFGFDLEPLIQSIRHVGLVNPPILKNGSEGLTVIAGYRRIMALKKLEAETAACRIIFEDDDVLPLECLLLNLHDNLGTRNLNDVEKGMVLSRLEAWVPRQEIVEIYLPLLGLRSHESNLRFFLEIERCFNVKIKTFVAEGRLSWQAVKLLSEIDAASRSAILNLISNLKLNVNQQVQLIDYIIDLSNIEGKSIPRIAADEELKTIGSDIHVNRPQHAKTILNNLRARRNPSVVSAEKRFRGILSDLNLPDGIQIIAPPFFEGEYYKVEVSFREGEDLKKKIDGLNRIKGLSKLVHPWKGGPE